MRRAARTAFAFVASGFARGSVYAGNPDGPGVPDTEDKIGQIKLR
jgi:hypothetical protein